MTNTKTSKRALFASVLSLLLCISMLVGSTFAWFTDSATTGVNKIQAGNLDVVLEYWDGDSWEDANEQTLDFIDKDDNDLWEPGCTYELPKLRVRNEGNLWLKYQIAITGIKGDAKLNEAIEWFNGADELNLETLNTWTNLAPKGTTEGATTDTSAEIKIVGYMKKSAGNEYQGLSIDGIGITVFATQVEAEYDSFDNQYDKDAPTIISINGKSYKTLNEAIEAAADGDVITVGGYVTYDMGNTTGGKDWSKVSIVAETDSGVVPTIAFSGYGSANPLKNATVSGVKIVDNTAGDVESAWEHGYFEVEGGTYTNVEFVNVVQANGTVTFDNCTFNGNANEYAAWVNSGDATFKNCTFVGARGLKAHEAYGSEVATVTVEGCAFNAMSKKPGIALGDLNADTTVTLKNNTFTDTQPGDGAYIKNHGVPYQYETDTDVTTFNFVAENNSTIINVYTVDDMWAVTNVSNCIAEDGTVDRNNVPAYNMAEVTINIMADLDMGDKWWRPICQYPSAEGHGGFAGTINGNGHTISNFKSSGNRTIDNSTMLDSGWGHCQGLIGIANGCTVTDLTFVNATVVSQNSLVGAVIGNSNGNNTVDNCRVIGMTAESNYYIAGIVGRAANGDKITNCSVKDVTITSWYTTTPENYSGAIYGSISTYDHDGDSTTDKIKGTVAVNDSTWENVVIKYTVNDETKIVNATH